MPHASIGSDVIVGFPGETERHVAALVDYLDTSPLTHVHVFPYSHRPGTEASGSTTCRRLRSCARGAPRCAPSASGLSRTFRASQAGQRSACARRRRRYRPR
jgi:hypothetical protein